MRITTENSSCIADINRDDLPVTVTFISRETGCRTGKKFETERTAGSKRELSFFFFFNQPRNIFAWATEKIQQYEAAPRKSFPFPIFWHRHYRQKDLIFVLTQLQLFELSLNRYFWQFTQFTASIKCLVTLQDPISWWSTLFSIDQAAIHCTNSATQSTALPMHIA